MYNINININCDAAVNIVNGFFIIIFLEPVKKSL